VCTQTIAGGAVSLVNGVAKVGSRLADTVVKFAEGIVDIALKLGNAFATALGTLWTVFPICIVVLLVAGCYYLYKKHTNVANATTGAGLTAGKDGRFYGIDEVVRFQTDMRDTLKSLVESMAKDNSLALYQQGDTAGAKAAFDARVTACNAMLAQFGDGGRLSRAPVGSDPPPALTSFPSGITFAKQQAYQPYSAGPGVQQAYPSSTAASSTNAQPAQSGALSSALATTILNPAVQDAVGRTAQAGAKAAEDQTSGVKGMFNRFTRAPHESFAEDSDEDGSEEDTFLS
jgi:hypothetical protein